MLGELENRVKGGAFFRILKIKNLNSASYKKHIPIWMMRIFGEMNGELKYSFPMASGTAKVFVS